jgi:hypothetical protein
LSMFRDYVVLADRMKMSIDSEFIDAMVSRILTIWGSLSNPTQQVQLASYMIRIEKLLGTRTLREHITSSIPSTTLSELPLEDLFTLISREYHPDFTASVETILSRVMSSRDLLSLLQQVSGSRDVRQRVMSVCADRVQSEPLPTDEAAYLFLRHCAWTFGRIPAELPEGRYEEMVRSALSHNPPDTVRSISQMGYPLRGLDSPMTDAIISCDLGDVSRLAHLLEGLSNLHKQYHPPAEVFSRVLDAIDGFLRTGRSHPSLWLMATWWHLAASNLEAVVGKAIRDKYTETVNTLTDHPANEFVQPVSSGRVRFDEVTRLMHDQGLKFAQTPRIPGTPIRVHFKVTLEGQNEVFVVITQNEKIPPIAKGINLNTDVVATLANGVVELAIVPRENFTGNIDDVIRNHLVR